MEIIPILKKLPTIFSGILVIAGMACGETITGMVADSVNGMPIDSVTVTSGGASTLTDAKGGFTLVLPTTRLRFIEPGDTPSLTWDADNGTFTWDGGHGDVSISVHSLQGRLIAKSGSGNNRTKRVFSVSHLPKGIYAAIIESQGHRSVYTIHSLESNHRPTFSLLPSTLGPAALNPAGKAAAVSDAYALTFAKNNFTSKTVSIPAGTPGPLAIKLKSPYPLRNIFHLFTSPDVPVKGPAEYADTKRGWTAPATLPQRIGGGIARHDMLYFGESYRRINLVINGKLAWEYDTKDDWEIDDIWMLSNGNILHAHMTYIEEINPKKEVIWHYDNPAGTQIHSCQPIGLDKVLFLQNQAPNSVAKLYNIVTKKFEFEKDVKVLTGDVHPQGRRLRMTGRGTYIASSLNLHKVWELDQDFKEIWSYTAGGNVWSAAPLKNGNVMIQVEATSTAMELNNLGQVVWQVAKSDVIFPAGTQFGNTQSCERLSNGNTVVFGNGGTNINNIQAFEVTPAKEVVWFLQDWQNLGDATAGQFLDEPGYPEIPGETNH